MRKIGEGRLWVGTWSVNVQERHKKAPLLLTVYTTLNMNAYSPSAIPILQVTFKYD